MYNPLLPVTPDKKRRHRPFLLEPIGADAILDPQLSNGNHRISNHENDMPIRSTYLL